MIGALLAGGAGRRMGGAKPAATLAGRPLARYPADALAAVCGRVAVVCKRDTTLPDLGAVERWDEPDEPRHPLTGIAYALERAGAPVLVCAADMPFVTGEALRALVAAASASAPAAVAVADGVLQPLLGVYAPACLEVFRRAPRDTALTATVESLDPVRVELPARVVWSVDTPEELAEAEAALA